MADVLVEGDQEAVTPAEQSAHEAAVAEGATAVQAESAAEAAEEAKLAAEVALDAARVNVESGATVAEATAQAQGAAESATVSAEMVMDALAAQGAAIAALTEEFKNSRKTAAPAEKPAASHDRPPSGEAKKRSHWYFSLGERACMFTSASLSFSRSACT
jgi:hypothetical protein